MKELSVMAFGQSVGVLRLSRVGKFSFRYNQAWLDNPNARPLSQSLPLQSTTFNERASTPFFGGLLPEELNREIIARNLGITARNDFTMLQEIGGECAGAVTIVPFGDESRTLIPKYKQISDTELAKIIEQLPEFPLLAGEAEIRLSLAGAQNKLSIYYGEDGYAIPLYESPSTHIIKPESERFEGLVDNEVYCLNLAEQVGLNVCKAEATLIGKHRCIIIERYDRLAKEGGIERLHQEDFCQALGISSRIKYQSEGGPRLSQCFDLVRKISANPAGDLIQLFNGVLYNYLIGNHDAHGKNFSLLYASFSEPSSVRLAPFYDLVSTAIYPRLTPKMAMKIHGADRPSELKPRDWQKYWESIQFSPTQAQKQSLQFIELVESKLVSPKNRAQEKIQSIITDRANSFKQIFMQ